MKFINIQKKVSNQQQQQLKNPIVAQPEEPRLLSLLLAFSKAILSM
jgi:hypothetical protein